MKSYVIAAIINHSLTMLFYFFKVNMAKKKKTTEQKKGEKTFFFLPCGKLFLICSDILKESLVSQNHIDDHTFIYSFVV